MNFDVLIDRSFEDVCTDKKLQPVKNKFILSLINDYEDGDWRYKHFQNFIWDNIAETSLSYKERCCLINQSHTLLTNAAQNLRLTDKENDISKGSELAEIVLYGIMKHYYSALPVVPKIFYKQNAQDNAKGADSVHIVLENESEYSLWFGEAKFYNSLEDARLSSIVTSVKNSLKTDKLKKENSIITNISDLDDLDIDDSLRASIRSDLSNKVSIDTLKSKINIPIFLLYECSCTKNQNLITDDYKKEVSEYHLDRATSYFTKQIRSMINDVFLYSEIKFHIILFPVPDKGEIVKKFIENVTFYKEQ